MNNNLNGKKIIVGVTGGIAAYKACEIVSRLVSYGAEVKVIQTQASLEFVSKLTFFNLSKNPVYTDVFSDVMNNILMLNILSLQGGQIYL